MGLDHQSNEKLIIVLERHNFTRGCLCSWIKAFCNDYDLASFPDAHSQQLAPLVGHAALAILSTVAVTPNDGWLASEISHLRSLRPNLPIIAIIDESASNAMTETALRLGFKGYIPTTSTLEVAAAVVHLVMAGGSYIPHLPDYPEPSSSREPPPNGKSPAVNDARLTPRERKVLDLLAQGMSNKTIAYRLSLSESTVKVHVHRIISKFKVHNRTEAVVSAYPLYAHAGTPQLGRVQVPQLVTRASDFPVTPEPGLSISDGGGQRSGALITSDRALG